MSFNALFVPTLPFENFKWQWACLQCTEGLNDPVVLLGVLFRMRKLELLNHSIKYSSNEFKHELEELADDIRETDVGVDLARRTGKRNLIRNSGQYWSALGLIPSERAGGVIRLTEFGQWVADRKISQTEFAALTIQTLTLPNRLIQRPVECAKWDEAGIELKPLLLLLDIVRRLSKFQGQGYLTKDELLKVVIPLSGVRGTPPQDYVDYVLAVRKGELDVSQWPSCCTSANDHRMGREFLLFLANYGYLNCRDVEDRECFFYNELLDDEVAQLLSMSKSGGFIDLVGRLKATSVVSEIERKRVQETRSRPNQARFRRAVLGTSPRCVITNVTMPEVLEAAHIVPYKYKGDDTAANGLTMRMDIHQLFDSGHLRIHANGTVSLTDRARMDYGALIPPLIHLPPSVNPDFVRWRWENYNGL